MKCLLLLTLAVLTLGQEKCTAPAVPEGVCSLAKDCLYIHDVPFNGSILDFIRNYGGCGKRNEDLLLCCPLNVSPVSTTSNSPPVTTSSIRPSTSPSVTELPCEAPARVVLPFGCVLPVGESKPWSEAQENCERLGMTLLEGISSQMELDELRTHFFTFLFGSSSGGVWLGMKELRWLEGGDPAPPSSSSLWLSGHPHQPGSGYDCGRIGFSSHGGSYLADRKCSNSYFSLCQAKKN